MSDSITVKISGDDIYKAVANFLQSEVKNSGQTLAQVIEHRVSSCLEIMLKETKMEAIYDRVIQNKIVELLGLKSMWGSDKLKEEVSKVFIAEIKRMAQELVSKSIQVSVVPVLEEGGV